MSQNYNTFVIVIIMLFLEKTNLIFPDSLLLTDWNKFQQTKHFVTRLKYWSVLKYNGNYDAFHILYNTLTTNKKTLFTVKQICNINLTLRTFILFPVFKHEEFKEMKKELSMHVIMLLKIIFLFFIIILPLNIKGNCIFHELKSTELY